MNTKDKKIKVLASAGMLGAALIWGFAFVIVKNSLNVIPATYMLAIRFSIAALVLGIVFIKRLKKINKKRIWEGMIIGFLLFVSYMLQTEGCRYTTAGKNAFLTTVYVVMVPFFHWLINKKKPNIYCIIAAFIAIFGIGLLSLQGDFSIGIGDMLSLACGVGFAMHMVFIDRFTQGQDPIVLTVLQLFFCAVFSWLTVGIKGLHLPPAAFTSQSVISMLYLGVLSSAIGFLLQTVGQKYTSPSTASLMLSMEAVFGTFFSILLLHEVLTPRMLLGCVFILLAIILAETRFEFLPFLTKEHT